MTQTNGQRKTPTLTKAKVPNSHDCQRGGNALANLRKVANSSAAATIDIPAKARCTCGRAP